MIVSLFVKFAMMGTSPRWVAASRYQAGIVQKMYGKKIILGVVAPFADASAAAARS
jgi:hypothetical protein